MARNKTHEALFKAVQNDDVKGAKRLIESKRINPNIREDGEYGGTPLHYAQSSAMVDMLCDKGADPKLVIKAAALIGGSYAPIHTAANGDVLRSLIKHGASITQLCAHNEQSVMHLVDTPEMVDAIMECGGEALLNQRDAEGRTPLDVKGAANSVDWPVFHRLQSLGAKDGVDLAREHDALVAAKKAEAATKPTNAKGASRA